MAHRLPRIAPIVIDRMRVQAWLEFHARTAVRYIVAPAGSGKTTCAVQYARGRTAVVFVSPPSDASEPELIAAIATAAGIAVETYVELVEHLAVMAPIEIIIDRCDDISRAARDVLGRIYRDVPDSVTFVYLARSRDAVAMPQARAQGLVDDCDPALFAFDTTEIARLCALLGRPQEGFAVTRLHEATHGWAMAVSGVCRTAAANGLQLPEALHYWRRLNEAAICELVDAAREHAAYGVRTAFDEVVAGRRKPDAEQLEAFRRTGLFVLDWNGRPALNPLVRGDFDAASPAAADVPIEPARIEMFGRFELTVGGKAVEWVRRRDRQIVQYLAMQPHGRATRAEIVAAFWPDADRQLAGQSLRSACSTIRRAIGDCVGRANVGRYFVGDHYLELILENTVISTRRFAHDFEQAELADARGDATAAFSHYRAAELAYRAPFLAGEPPTAWAIPYESRFAAMHERLALRLDALSRDLDASALGRHASREARHSLSA